MTVEELQACRDGYIYVHDMSARRDTMNCCLFDVKTVLEGGFEMGNLWYNEPKSLDVAFDVIGDIVLSAASQQYGGFTVPEVDKLLAPYAEKTYVKNRDRYIEMGISEEKAEAEAMKDVRREFEQVQRICPETGSFFFIWYSKSDLDYRGSSFHKPFTFSVHSLRFL